MKLTSSNFQIESLSNYLKQRYTPDTAKAYIREINNFLSNYNNADKAIYKDLVQYIGTLRNRYTNGKTINRILCSIKAYYDFLSHTGSRKDNPAKSIRLRDKSGRQVQLQDLFTTEELESFLYRKERYNKSEYRNKVLMSLLIYQALHPTEIEQLTLNDINLQQGTIYIKPTPKSNSRELQLKSNQIMLFYQYINEIRPKLLKSKNDETKKCHAEPVEALLLGLTGNPMQSEDITKHVIRSYRNKLSGRKVNATTIRQSVISNLLKQGHDLRIVQSFTGHKYASTTEQYKQTNVEQLKQAINLHHPIK